MFSMFNLPKCVRNVTCFISKEVRQSDDHTRARGFVAKSEDGKGRLSFNVNGKDLWWRNSFIELLIKQL